MAARWLRSTSARLAWAVAAAFWAASLLLGMLVYGQVSSRLDQDTRAFVRSELDGLVDLSTTSGNAALQREIVRRVRDTDNADLVYALLSSHGRLLAGDPAALAARGQVQGWTSFVDARSKDQPRVLVTARVLADGTHLVVGMRTRAEDGFLAVMVRAAWIALAVAVGLGMLAGWITSRWVARKLLRIEHAAGLVAHGKLRTRVVLDHSGDAFDLLGQRVNAMLDRLEELVDGIRHVTNHIAHDLRTPLSRVRNRLEGVREAHALPADVVRELDAAIDESDGLMQTIAALLRLARIEGEPLPEDAALFDLQPMVEDAIELYEPIAAERSIRIEASLQAVQIHGDADQWFQAITNLIDNAVKYAPAGSAIHASLQASETQALLMLADHGPGIPPQDRERVFDRFERLESHRGTPGYGLGLSLVRAVVRRHGGDVQLMDNSATTGAGQLPGLRVCISVPLSKA